MGELVSGMEAWVVVESGWRDEFINYERQKAMVAYHEFLKVFSRPADHDLNK